jgi:hypothetical protein
LRRGRTIKKGNRKHEASKDQDLKSHRCQIHLNKKLRVFLFIEIAINHNIGECYKNSRWHGEGRPIRSQKIQCEKAKTGESCHRYDESNQGVSLFYGLVDLIHHATKGKESE